MQNKDIDIYKYKQSGFRIDWDGKHIYIDPYQIPDDQPKADILFLTHDHFDHFDLASIGEILQNDTDVIGPKTVSDLMHANFANFRFHYAFPGEFIPLEKRETVMDVKYCAMPAYNQSKVGPAGQPYHPKASGWVGYVMTFGETTVYHMGDTDFVIELHAVTGIDLCLVPISGTYVMDPAEAANAVNQIKPKIAVPMHFDAGIVGSPEQVSEFRKLVSCEVIEMDIVGATD